MNEEAKSKAFERLTPERKGLIELVQKNMMENDSLWVPGWRNTGVPVSAVTGKKYRGINNMNLTLVSMVRGY